MLTVTFLLICFTLALIATGLAVYYTFKWDCPPMIFVAIIFLGLAAQMASYIISILAQIDHIKLPTTP